MLNPALKTQVPDRLSDLVKQLKHQILILLQLSLGIDFYYPISLRGIHGRS